MEIRRLFLEAPDVDLWLFVALLTGSAAIAIEHIEPNAGQYRSDASDDPTDTDDWENRSQDKGRDTHENEQYADNYLNHLLSFRHRAQSTRDVRVQSIIHYAFSAI
jgi:hypothetical protein